MEDDIFSLVPFKLVLIVISHDFKNINKGLTPTITSLQRNNVIWTQVFKLKTKEKDLKVFKKSYTKQKPHYFYTFNLCFLGKDMGCRRNKSLIHASLGFFFYPYDQKLKKQTRSLPNQFEAICI